MRGISSQKLLLSLKTLFPIIFLLITSLPIMSNAAWNIEIVDSISQDQRPSLALDSNGYAHISYWDSSNKYLKYATNVCGSWVSQELVFTGAGFAGDICIDSLDYVHISYRDFYYNDLMYISDFGSWVPQIVDRPGLVGSFNSIFVDTVGNVHISYQDSTNGNLKYVTNTSGSWVAQTVDNNGWVGHYTSISGDSLGNIHISYMDYSNDDLKYATNASGSWVVQRLDSTGSVGWNTSIAIDSLDNIHITYGDLTNADIKYITNASGAWVIQTIDGGNDAFDPSIAMDSMDNVHISYMVKLGSHSYEVRYITNASGSWVSETLESNSYFSSPSIEIDTSDNVHIVYYNANGGDLKYATNVATTNPSDIDGDGDGYSELEGDCDDSNPNIYPGGPPARIIGEPPVYYSSLQAAYNAAENGDTIQIHEVVLAEALHFNIDKSVNLIGGYNCSYRCITGVSIVSGSMTITNGYISIENTQIE